MSWPVMTLGQALREAEVFVDGDWVESKDQDPDGDVRLVQLADVGDGEYLDKSSRFLTTAKARELRCTYLQRGDVMVARMPDPLGRACIFPGDMKPSVTVVDVCIIRPHANGPDARWLMHCLNSPEMRGRIAAFATGTTRSRISRGNLAKVKIPLPPLPEQRRIAEILDKADALRAKRRAALAQLDTLTQSIFLDMFGDPATNPRGCPTQPLTSVCNCYSGGTPSKSEGRYWEGRLPWFSPKDLKQDDLFDSEDHVDEAVLRETNLRLLPRDTVAIVVRGMILAHSFPVSVLRVAATINQDLKALLPRTVDLDSQFLAHCLRVQRRAVLTSVSESAHGTKRLDAEALGKIMVTVPPVELQQEFSRRVAQAQQSRAGHKESMLAIDALFASLQHRAFHGEL